jgi:hypothetical protein
MHEKLMKEEKCGSSGGCYLGKNMELSKLS